ncbi:MAG: hypothetical protein WC393_01710 [Candidatus Nanoarchaeia archaeon]|jgi:hypothetical protein
MASEDEIIYKIKGFKEQNNPNFKKYMDFYKEKFPDFYESKLKILENYEKKEDAAVSETEKAAVDFSAKVNEPVVEQESKDEVFADKKVLTQPVFNINDGKKETNNTISNGITNNAASEKPINAKKKSKKIILIALLVLVIVGAVAGVYFLLL